MSRTMLSVGLMATIGLPASIVSASLVQSLEPPTYAAVDVNGADSGQWSVVTYAPGVQTATVTTSAAYHGTQGLELVDGGAGWLNNVNYDLNASNVTAAGLTDDGNASWALKVISGTAQLGIAPIHTLSDGTSDLLRGGLFIAAGTGDILYYNYATSIATDIGDLVPGRWNIFNLTSHDDGSGNLTTDVTVLDTVTNTLVVNVTGLSAGSASGRTYWGGISMSTNSTPAGTFQVDGFTFNAPPVPEPASLSLLGLGALAMLRRRK